MRHVVRNLLASALLLLTSAPAYGEPSPVPVTPRPAAAPPPQRGEPTIAQIEHVIAEIGAWTLDYGALLTEASSVMDEVEGYTGILDRFANGDLRARRAREEMQAWRTNAIARAQALRARAVALRAPPSLALLGPEGGVLENAFAIARNDLPALVDEMIVSLDAFAAVGEEAITNPNTAASARHRAVYQSSIQLIRIDSRRISATAAALANDHPNRHVMEATIAYYAGLTAFPAHELGVIEGAEANPAAVAATLRQSGRDMRASLAQASLHADRMAQHLRSMPAPPEAQQMRQVIIRMADTFPATVRVYGRLADTIDNAALFLEQGGTVADAWARQEEAALPVFDQIAQLENERAQLATQLRR